MKAKVSLVGAGPGDTEMITVKGLKALQSADVVLYDDLVLPEMLDYVSPATPKYHVGKRAGRMAFSQDEINEMIIEMALAFGHVVRLKGGDPFVFGRGYEEYHYTKAHGIDCQVIAGVSSSIAVPASQHIPVTCRGISESFWVITGTTRTGGISDDLKLAARSHATVVILMGLKKLGEICRLYASEGKADLPVAVIQNGTRPDERCVTGTISDIEELVKKEQPGCPAIIVTGEVVGLHPDFIKRYLIENQLYTV